MAGFNFSCLCLFSSDLCFNTPLLVIFFHCFLCQFDIELRPAHLFLVSCNPLFCSSHLSKHSMHFLFFHAAEGNISCGTCVSVDTDLLSRIRKLHLHLIVTQKFKFNLHINRRMFRCQVQGHQGVFGCPYPHS